MRTLRWHALALRHHDRIYHRPNYANKLLLVFAHVIVHNVVVQIHLQRERTSHIIQLNEVAVAWRRVYLGIHV